MSTLIRQIINTPNSAKPPGPINHAIIVDRMVYVSGCIGANKDTLKLVEGGIVEQLTQALRNMKSILQAAGSDVDKLVKVTIFLKDLNDFAVVNDIYRSVLKHDFPARSAVQVARLPADALIEIECIGITGNVKTRSGSKL